MRSYITFEVENFIRDYQANKKALANLRERLEEIPELPGIDLTRDKVQTSPGNALESEALLRLFLESEIAAYEDYFRRFDKAYAAISPEDRIIIDAYKDGARYAVDRLCYDLGLEKTRVYELRRIAFDHFAVFAI